MKVKFAGFNGAKNAGLIIKSNVKAGPPIRVVPL